MATGSGGAPPYDRRVDRRLLIAAYALPLVALVVAAALYPLNAPLTPDTEFYVYVGDNFWRGDGLYDLNRELFTAHGPFGPILASFLGSLTDGGLVAPRLFSYLMLAIAFVLVIRISDVLGGVRAAIMAAVLLIVIPFVWSRFGSPLIDQEQLVLSLVMLLLLLYPRNASFGLAGVAFGISLLFKETNALAILVPLAWLGAMPRKEWARLYGLFLAGAAITALWWWVVVWVDQQVIFPFQRLDNAIGMTDYGLWPLLFVAFAIAWVAFAVRFHGEARARVLLLAVAAVVPPAILVIAKGMDTRHLLLLTSLSIVLVAVLAARSGKVTYYAIGGVALLFAVTGLPHLHREPEPSKDYASLSEKLDANIRPGEEITATWMNIRQIARETDDVYVTELLPIRYCPCKGEDLVRIGFPRRLARTNNRSWLIVQGTRFAEYLAAKTPGVSIVFVNRDPERTQRGVLLRVDKRKLPSLRRLRRIVGDYEEYTNPTYDAGQNLVPFPY